MTLLILLLAGIAGLFSHWLKKWGRGQTASTFKEYMESHKRYSIASVTAMIGAIAGMCVVGDVELTQQTLATAFLAGFAVDSTLNKAPDEE